MYTAYFSLHLNLILVLETSVFLDTAYIFALNVFSVVKEEERQAVPL